MRIGLSMWYPYRGRLLLAAALGLATAACAPRFYEREMLVLEGPGLKDYTVKYEEPGDCLLKQPVPSHYEVTRPQYRLQLVPHAGFSDDPPTLDLTLRGSDDLRASIPGETPEERSSLTTGERRYRLAVRDPGTRPLQIEIARNGRQIGIEGLVLRMEHCRVLMWREQR